MAINKKKTAVSSLIVLLLPIFCTNVGAASTNGPIANEKSLQAIIDQAQPGSKVLVEPGIYRGEVTINKPLQLLAKGDAVIEGTRKGPVITVTSDHVEIKGFTIRDSGTDLTDDDAGIKLKSNFNIIADNSFINDLHGIYLFSSSHNQIHDNKIEGIQKLDINDRGNGIHFFHSEDNVIEHNLIYFTRDGMYFSYSSNNRVDNNTIHDARYGLHYMYSNDNSFHNNVFTHNTGGSALMYSNHIELKNNYFENHRGDKGTGIVLNTCDDSVIENNKIINNTRGIFMDMSARNIIRNNQIGNNFIGMQLTVSSSENSFYNNNWIADDAAIITENNSENNSWFDKDTKQGNYWSNAELVDLNSDGKSDIPFHITTVQSYLIGQFPDLRFLQNSPAMKLLDFIYRQFPIFQIPSPVDKYPLMKPLTNIKEG